MNTNNLQSIMQPSTDQHSFVSLSKIIPADKELLQKTVHHIRPFSKNYEDAWGYIIQATRYGGFKWYDSTTNSLIFFGRKSNSDSTLVVPSFFAEPEYLAKIVIRVQNDLHAPQTILKNVNTKEISFFLPYGFRPYKNEEGWSPEARFDDQTYPQLIINLKKLTEAKGTIYENLRAALRKNYNITIRKYRESDRDAVLKIFRLKDADLKRSLKKSNGIYYESHEMYPNSDTDKFVFTDYISDRIVGFTATSDITPLCTALVASGFRSHIKNVSVWGIYQTLTEKYQKGFQLATLGGCEFGETYKFKREKFRPTEEIEKTHLIYP